MSHNPFAKPRPNPKRTQPRRTGDRVRLKGEAMMELRRRVYERDGPFCQSCGCLSAWTQGDLSHLRHGSNKSDTLESCIWECRPCHRKRHNAGGKPCPRKPGRAMNHKDAEAYWVGTECFCGKEQKRSGQSFGPECLLKLPPQLRYDVNNTVGEDYLRAMALAEQALLKESV